MLRSLHMKLVMLMVLLILSLMTVVGVFLVNSVRGFYLEEFYSQMSAVFQDQELSDDLRTPTEEGEDSVELLRSILSAYSGSLGVDGINRKFYILNGASGEVLAGSGGANDSGEDLIFTPNLTAALRGENGDKSSIAAGYMDVALPFQRGDTPYIIYILDNTAVLSNLVDQIFVLIVEALGFGLVIAILLSFLLSKTMVTPIQRLTEGAMRVAKGDFTHRIQVSSRDEIGVLTDTFNNMARQLRDTIRQVENERNKLDTLFLHMTDGVVAFDRRGEIIQSNPAAEEMLGTALPIGGTVDYAQLFGDIASLEAVFDAETEFLEGARERDGRSLELLLAPFDRDNPDQAGVLVVIHDVTERNKTEEMRKEFVANVSHELRTPLTNIHSYAETLVDNAGALPPDTEKNFLSVILSESDRMAHIVQDLLTLSRFDSGRGELNLTKFSFAEAIESMVSANMMEAQRHGHSLTLELEPGLPRITADRERITQVMMNVVGNSIKYTPDGGTITVDAGMRGGKVWIEVSDTGIGIPEEEQARIFQRFYRGSQVRQEDGVGVGLYLSRQIITAQGGYIKVQSTSGKGSIFSVFLPT